MPTANNITPTTPTIENGGTPINVARPSHPAEKDMSMKPMIEMKYGLYMVVLTFIKRTMISTKVTSAIT